MVCDRVSDVVENGVRFANKILTHNRMHWHWSTIIANSNEKSQFMLPNLGHPYAKKGVNRVSATPANRDFSVFLTSGAQIT